MTFLGPTANAFGPRRIHAQSRTDEIALAGPGEQLSGPTKKVLETALAAELTDHLECEPGEDLVRQQCAERVATEALLQAQRGSGDPLPSGFATTNRHCLE